MWGNRGRAVHSDSDLSRESAGLLSKIKRRFRLGSKGRYNINNDVMRPIGQDGITVLRRESIECDISPKTKVLMHMDDQRKTMSLPRVPVVASKSDNICHNLNDVTVVEASPASPKRTSVIAMEDVPNSFLISDERAVDLDTEHTIPPDEYDDVFDPGYETLEEVRKKIKMCGMTNKSNITCAINASVNAITNTAVHSMIETEKSEIGNTAESAQSNRDSGLGSPNLESNSPDSKRSVRTSSLDSSMVSDLETIPDEVPAATSSESEATLTDETNVMPESSANLRSIQEGLYANSALKAQRKSMSKSSGDDAQKPALKQSLSDSVSREVVVENNHLLLPEKEPPPLPARNYTLENELLPDNFIDDEPIHMSLTELQSKSRRRTSEQSVDGSELRTPKRANKRISVGHVQLMQLNNVQHTSQSDAAIASVSQSNFAVPAPDLPPRKPIRMSDFLETMRQLKSCSWYWGPLSWEEARAILDNKADGSFLVRDSSNDCYILTISFKSQGKICHTRIEHHKGMFSFWSQPDSHGKRGIVAFIEQAMHNSRNHQFLYFLRPTGPGQPPTPIYLLYPISRFNHIQSLQHLCRFIILCYVRRDHIDSLPIPARIKDYLRERQCYIEYWEDEVGCRNCNEVVTGDST